VAKSITLREVKTLLATDGAFPILLLDVGRQPAFLGM
jgi:hypothetical protein